MLHNHSQWHTKRAPNPTKKVHSIEEENPLSNKIDAILAYIAKQNSDNVPLQELVGNNNENMDVIFIRNFGNNGYGNNYNNSYGRLPYVPNKYVGGNKSNELENMLYNHSQCHTKRAPNPTKKVHSIEEENPPSNKIDAILAIIAKHNSDNVPQQELVGNNNKNMDLNFITNFGNNGFGKNYNN
jgi:hypothetical protein